jgi:deoxyhypusine synthase
MRLQEPIEPIEVAEKSISKLLEEMAGTAFQGRRLGEAFLTWVEMLKDEDTIIFFGLSGAMVPAGMRKVISFLIKNRYIDTLVSTGANIFHDIHEALGNRHYKGSPSVNDEGLLRQGIDRIHDVFAEEKKFREVDNLIAELCKELDLSKEYSSREFLNFLAEKLEKISREENSILLNAYAKGVPVFTPALSDSSIGIAIATARGKGYKVIVSHAKDVNEITQIVEKAKKTGVVYIGGGVPKNFIQQTEVVASILGFPVKGHEYAIQFTTDSPQFGGSSGATFEEAVSWGKIAARSKKVQVFVDATIALPVITHALNEKKVKRKAPDFSWSDGRLELKY